MIRAKFRLWRSIEAKCSIVYYCHWCYFVNLDLSFIFCSHCWYLFLQYSDFWCKKPQIFGFQILRVIWASCVSGQTKRIWWATLNLLYLMILFKLYIPILDNLVNYNSWNWQLIFIDSFSCFNKAKFLWCQISYQIVVLVVTESNPDSTVLGQVDLFEDKELSR